MNRKTAALAAAGAAALAGLAACGTTRTVHDTAAPAPAVTVTVPGPTVTATVTHTAQPAVLASKTFSGSGQWNSPEFTLSCGTPVVAVSYSYSGNTTGYGGSNFIADLKSPGGDDQMIANTIAVSGGATTTLYPDTSMGGHQYYLSVQADGSWRFRLTETCG